MRTCPHSSARSEAVHVARLWARQLQAKRSRLPRQQCNRTLSRADSAASFGYASPDNEPQEIKVLPRLKEKDPFKVLGIPPDSDFEEVQAARNFLSQEYRAHEPSREHVEWAFEKVLNSKYSLRQKQGFRPGRTKRGQQVAFEAPPTLQQRLKALIDPSATLVTFANELVIYALIGVWSMFTVPQNNLPVMLTFAYTIWKTFSKRNLRNPDGPYFMNSPIWGALLLAVVGMVASTVLAEALKFYFPFWRLGINEIRAAAFLIPVFMCPINVFLK